MSSYITHYLRGDIARQNCYSCTLSNEERVGDFTLGDFWGIDKTYPEIVLRGKEPFSLKGGISCVLVNTPKAARYMDALNVNMKLHEVDFACIAKHNSNLREPTNESAMRDELLRMYRENGYAGIEERYRKKIAQKRWKYWIKNALRVLLPSKMRILGSRLAHKCRHICKRVK